MTTAKLILGGKAAKTGGRMAAWRTRARAARRAEPSGRPQARAAALLMAGAGLGALLAWLADPRRRAMHRQHAQQAASAARSQASSAASTARHAANVAQGAAAQATAPMRDTETVAGGEPPDDVTLVRKVESIAFREAGVPTGRVSVDAAGGVVHLRGELDDREQIAALVAATERVDGVRAVQNLLHLPGTPAPTRS